MSTYVQRAITEVVPEPEPAPATGEKQAKWEQEDRARQQAESRRRVILRTRAEGFDD